MKALETLEQSAKQEQAKLAIEIVALNQQLKAREDRLVVVNTTLNTCAELRKAQDNEPPAE